MAYIQLPFYTAKIKRYGSDAFVNLNADDVVKFGDTLQITLAQDLDYASRSTVNADKLIYYDFTYTVYVRIIAGGVTIYNYYVNHNNDGGKVLTIPLNTKAAYNAFKTASDTVTISCYYHVKAKKIWTSDTEWHDIYRESSNSASYEKDFPLYERTFSTDIRFYDVWGRQCLGSIASINGSTVTLEENAAYSMASGAKVRIGETEYTLAAAVTTGSAAVTLTETPTADEGDYVYNAKEQRLTDAAGFAYEQMAAHKYQCVQNTGSGDGTEYSATVTFTDTSRSVTIAGVTMTRTETESSPACYVKRMTITGPNCDITQNGTQENPVEGTIGEMIYQSGRKKVAEGQIHISAEDDNGTNHGGGAVFVIQGDSSAYQHLITVPYSVLQPVSFLNTGNISVMRVSDYDSGGQPVVGNPQDCDMVRIAGIGRKTAAHTTATLSYDQYADVDVEAAYRLQGTSPSFTGNYNLTDSGDARALYGFIAGSPAPVEPNEVCMVRITATDCWGQSVVLDSVSPQVYQVPNPVVLKAYLNPQRIAAKWRLIAEGGLFGIEADKNTNAVYLNNLYVPGVYTVTKASTTVYDNDVGGAAINNLHQCGILVMGDGETFGFAVVVGDISNIYKLTCTDNTWTATAL